MLITHASQSDPRFLSRADPQYWHPAYEGLLDDLAYPVAELGEFITHITYGPIITGRQPPRAVKGGVALVNQGQIGPAGVELREATWVPEGCAWDLPRARLQAEDLVIARSGVGSLARNRLAVYTEGQPAVVGSFVDLVRLSGMDPFYAAAYLKTRFGWGQIHRLLNGVATPNISFRELQALRVAVPPAGLQETVRQRYLNDVYPLHLFGDVGRGEAMRELAAFVEGLLADGDRP